MMQTFSRSLGNCNARELAVLLKSPLESVTLKVAHLSTTANAVPVSRAGVNSHALRSEVNGLLHQRPTQKLTLPVLVSTITHTHKQLVRVGGVLCPLAAPGGSSGQPDGPTAAAMREQDHAHLTALCHHFHVHPPPLSANFFSADLAGACRVRWERHTEVQTYTFTRDADAAEAHEPFHPKHLPTSLLPAEWLRSIPGSAISAMHMAALEQAPEGDLVRALAPHFNRSGFITGCALDNDRFRAVSDWRVHDDGFARLILFANGDAQNKGGVAGQVLQQLIELEKYRVLACMGLPFAQAVGTRIDELNAELQSVMDDISLSRKNQFNDLDTQRRLLDRLCALTAITLKVSASSHYRFSASSAYSKIVDDRISFLQMAEMQELPSMSAFIKRVLDPAIRTCDHVAARLEVVASSSQLAADLLRTSLTVQQQAAHSEQLEQIKHTARTQLLLQECVEGLSVVAITYYSTGVLGYLAKAAYKLDMLPVSPDVAVGLSVPFLGAAVYFGLHRLKHGVLSPPTGKQP